MLLREMPALLLRLPVSDLLGVIAYIEGFMLLESSAIWVFLLVLAILLPRSLFSDRLVAQGAVMVLVSTVWAVLLQVNYPRFLELNSRLQAAWIVAYFVSLGLFSYYVWQSKAFETVLRRLVSRIEPLAVLYLVLGVLGLLSVLVRNLV